MGIGKLLTRHADTAAAEHRSAGAGFQVIIDGNPVNHPMQLYRGGMSIPGAWRAVTVISDILGSVPWNAYRELDESTVERVGPTPPLLEQPSPPDTRMTTFSSWGLDLIWHGNAFGIVADRDLDGHPTAVTPVPAELVGVRRVNEWANYPLPRGALEYLVGGMRFSAHDVIHVKGMCAPGALRGFGVLEAHLNGTLALAMELQRQAQSLSRHGVPTGKLKSDNPDLTAAEAAELKAAWMAAQRDRTVAVLNSTTDFEPLSWNPEELQLVEARKFSLHELALIFGLPLSFVGADQSSRTYSNIEQESLNLLKYTMNGHLARFEQTLSLAFPLATQVKANLDAVLRADTLTRYQSHQIGITAGFLTRDEAREIENRPPLTTAQRAELRPAPTPKPSTQEEQAA